MKRHNIDTGAGFRPPGKFLTLAHCNLQLRHVHLLKIQPAHCILHKIRQKALNDHRLVFTAR